MQVIKAVTPEGYTFARSTVQLQSVVAASSSSSFISKVHIKIAVVEYRTYCT